MSQSQHQDHLRGFFGGSGSGLFSRPECCAAVVALTGKSASEVTVLYIGTATYDIAQSRATQTDKFAEQGCSVIELKVATSDPDPAEMAALCAAADVVVVSGGNTLYACDRWQKIGLVPHLSAAQDRGAVMTGGSAGAICWFDAGHSDSADPETYKRAMLAAGVGGEAADDAAPLTEEDKKGWKYIRVPALGFYPGLMCPHHDKTQSNGSPRYNDFDEMMLRHPSERGICIDHWAALVVEGDKYRVWTMEGEQGSVGADGTFTEPNTVPAGKPGIFVKDVVAGVVQVSLAPSSGLLSDLFKPATAMVEDPNVASERIANPF